MTNILQKITHSYQLRFRIIDKSKDATVVDVKQNQLRFQSWRVCISSLQCTQSRAYQASDFGPSYHKHHKQRSR